mmetsp:Transcript_9650/g.12751  ORF Transcript_9650/g.12751 Transcript_9650/m.12751 type:complete len:468 (-) Transcript_9650:241-1644(-)|eukprot:CAMPEP_0198140216 /NCGR_PEP_ID=MMETSP1443-20131203/3418_1 /TAXON_ID=186043 /ORGANISM="Entomoneis sp., Strain CCMP2396" /LENGTH=467 /DNA_ID=CAMNT_0043802577 /DNA_START=159 /DNA_END=1562 /DNA_ORIENTATION=-
MALVTPFPLPVPLSHVVDNQEEEEEPVNASASLTTTNLPPLPLCQFDRYWLQKLVLKHHKGPTDIAINTNDASELAKVKIFASAPMVDQSDLPYRLQCRRYGTNMCFTPMIHARQFVTVPKYRQQFTMENIPSTDRPLIAQLCGGTDPETMLQCALQVQDFCDGIDINCGCPQGIARRGNYGAFLLEQEETLLTLVKYLVPRLRVPLSVKVRLLPEEDVETRVAASLSLYTKLLDAGIHLLTVHGRTRHQKSHETGSADWQAVAKTVENLGHKIPILANGSIGSPSDVRECLNETKADGIMSSEAILEYPPLFSHFTLTGEIDKDEKQQQQTRVGRLALAREYLALARQYPTDKGGQASGFKCVRTHMHRFLHADLQVHIPIRDAIVQAKSNDQLEAALDTLEQIHANANHNVQEEELSWYIRHRVEKSTKVVVRDEDEELKAEKKLKTEKKEVEEEDEEALGGWLF